MAKEKKTEYFPDVVMHPGVTLRETLTFLGMSQAELFRRTQIPEKTISAIVTESSSITTEVARKLELALGVPASLWLNLQSAYDEFLQLQEERTRMTSQLEWLSNFPLNAMIKLEWLERQTDKVDQLSGLLSFLGAASPQAWEQSSNYLVAAFRRQYSAKVNRYALCSWLRKGEIIGSLTTCESYNENIFRQSLIKSRALTRSPLEDVSFELNRICNPCGVAVALVHELPGAPVSGATRWLTPKKALIQLSLRYKTDDQFWFSFFHEAGHIVLHHKRGVLIEEDSREEPEEHEASQFAADLLIPPSIWSRFTSKIKKPLISKNTVVEFAERVGIAPGIVVGRLQHEHFIKYDLLNSLKRRLVWE